MREVPSVDGVGLTLSVVVPATDQPATLGRCRAAILAADDPPEELIVIEEPPGAGPAAARNAGAERATGSVLVFIDSDVIVRRDVFSRIRAAFEADPELMALFGSYDDSPSAHGVVSTYRNLLHHYMHQRYDGLASTFWAGLGAVRRDTFMAVGGFDARALPRPVRGGHRTGSSPPCPRLPHRARSEHPGGASQEVVASAHGRHRFPASRRAVDRAAARAWPGGGTPEREQASPPERRLLAGAVGAASAGRRGLTAILTMLFLRLNVKFYALLLRRAGPRTAIVGIGLHIVHNVTALAAAPVGAVRFALNRPQPLWINSHHRTWPDSESQRNARFTRTQSDPIVGVESGARDRADQLSGPRAAP